MSSTSTALVATPVRAAVNAASSLSPSRASPLASISRTALNAVSQVNPAAPSTPVNNAVQAQPAIPSPSPGAFRHPRLTEVIQRQSKNTLTQRNIRDTLINVVAITFSVVFSDTLYTVFSFLLNLASIPDAPRIISTSFFLIRLLFLTNIVNSLRPAIPYLSPKDAIADIPLTPSQRSLLGLSPSVQATPVSPAPGSTAVGTTTGPQFITPPRYRRSSGSLGNTPQSSDRNSTDRRSISANYSSSPMSTSRYTLGFSPSPAGTTSTFRRTASGSLFSPNASPLLHKAVTQSRYDQDTDFDISGVARRSSFGGTASGFGFNRSRSVMDLARQERGRRYSGSGVSNVAFSKDKEQDRDSWTTSTSAFGKRSPATSGLNYKWLYDKGVGLPRSESMGF